MVSNYCEEWKDIHENAKHGLVICDKICVRILGLFHFAPAMKALPVSKEIHGEKILLVLVYRPPR